MQTDGLKLGEGKPLTIKLSIEKDLEIFWKNHGNHIVSILNLKRNDKKDGDKK